MAGSARLPRQATACNWCREHKMKCDTGQPSCRNCSTRGLECITTDLRRPGRIGRRREPVGRRGKQTIEQRSLPLPQEPAPYTVSGPSPPSPTEKVLVPMIAQETPLPSMFIAPFAGEEQPCRVSQAERPSQRSNIAVITDKSRSRCQAIGSGCDSVYLLVQYLDLLFTNRDFWQPIFPHFQHGLAYSMEVSLPFLTSLPDLPPPAKVDEYLVVFFSKIYPIYPIVERDSIYELIQKLRPILASRSPSFTAKDYPHLACLYSLFSASADELEGHPTDIGASYLEAAYSLYGHLVAIPYATSVQALLLLAIILRSRSKEGASWEVLGQAIRIAQSLGLHRDTPNPLIMADGFDMTGTVDLSSRLWWTAYILEKAMVLESGRPSAIHEEECDQTFPQPVWPPSLPARCFDYFGALIRLAQIQDSIIQLFYRKQGRTTKEILHEMGRIDRSLLDLVATFPEDIRLVPLAQE